MRITFWGAAREVTGSCFLFESGGVRLLVDCGMFQGSRFADERNREPFPFDAKSIDAVLVTHAHLDHTGRIPQLVGAGFRGPVYTTKPTAALARIMWDDAFEVMRLHQEKEGHALLFTEQDIEEAVSRIHAVEYNTATSVDSGVTATWHDAGHVLGSAFIEIAAEGKRVIFSGDLGNRDVPILRTLTPRPPADLLLLESTYGSHTHEDPRTRADRLRNAILRTVQSRGTLLIPAFALERIQEILYELNALVEGGQIPTVPIFLDSPLAIRATEIFTDYIRYYDAEAFRRVSGGDDLFAFPGLRKTLTRDASRTINDVPPPKVVIAGAGMMTGGRIFHHLRRYLPDPNSTILIVGYQARGTLGRRLLDGQTEITIFGKPVTVRAQIEKIGGYSAHADQTNLLAWARGAGGPLPRICLVHGDPDAQDQLAEQLRATLQTEVVIPERGTSIQL